MQSVSSQAREGERAARPVAGRARERALWTGGTLAAAVAGSYHLLNGDGDVDAAHRLITGAIDSLADNRDAHNKVLIEGLYTLLLVCFFSGRPELWEPFDAAVSRLAPRPPELLAILGPTFSDPARRAAAGRGSREPAARPRGGRGRRAAPRRRAEPGRDGPGRPAG